MINSNDNIIKYTTTELINSQVYNSWVSANTDTSKNSVETISSEQVVSNYTYTITWSDSSLNKSGVFTLITTDANKRSFAEDSHTYTVSHYVSGDEILDESEVSGAFESFYRFAYVGTVQSGTYFQISANPSNVTEGTHTSFDVTYEVSIEANYTTQNTYEVTLYYNSDISYIPVDIFKSNGNLKTFEIHSDIITSLEDGVNGKSSTSVFAGSSLQSLIIDVENFEKFGDYSLYNCSNFTELTLYSTSIPTIGEDAFYLRDTIDRTLFVPESCLSEYQDSSWGSVFTSILPIPVPPTPPVPPTKNYGFNLSGMKNVDYTQQGVVILRN